MMNLGMIKNTITRTAGRGGLLAKKFAPEILLFTGIAGGVGTVVLSCKATLKAEEVIDKAQENINKVKQAKQMADDGTISNYSEKDYKKDMSVVYVQTGLDFVKLYGPAVTLGIASIGCILGSYGLMRKRNLALIAAYKTVEESFAKYRKRVIDELGVETDRHFKYGTKLEKIQTIDENGDAKEETVVTVDSDDISQYARFFDESCVSWSNVPEYNLTFLKCQQNFANDLLQARGHIFLNEVYDMLGIPRTKAGSVVGWVRGNKDNCVDFGIFDVNVSGYRNDKANDTIGEERRDFVNGYKSSILLDFNVDGVIYDLI